MNDHLDDNKKIIKNLVLSGGSIKGISHIGAVKKLIESKYLEIDKLECIVGVSVGSILGMFIILGFTIDEIWDFVYKLDISKLFKPDPLLFLDKYGVENGATIYNMIEEILEKKNRNKTYNI